MVFSPPARPLARAAFARRKAVALDRRSQMLTLGGRVFLNGERAPGAPALRRLAERRRGLVPAAQADLFYEWYLAGYLHPE